MLAKISQRIEWLKTFLSLLIFFQAEIFVFFETTKSEAVQIIGAFLSEDVAVIDVLFVKYSLKGQRNKQNEKKQKQKSIFSDWPISMLNLNVNNNKKEFSLATVWVWNVLLLRLLKTSFLVSLSYFKLVFDRSFK